MADLPTGPDFADVLESAARLQRLVSDAVLVDGTAAALHAGHRRSLDHHHALGDLRERLDAVLDALESDAGWALNRLVPAKIILGELDGIETGIRQLIRTRPLEVEEVRLPSGSTVRVPTAEEALRIKAFLAMRRNQTRDYLDLAALADLIGPTRAAGVLSAIDEYYGAPPSGDEAVASQVVRQLADPRPADRGILDQLAQYKELAARWTDWRNVRDVLAAVAAAMVEPE